MVEHKDELPGETSRDLKGQRGPTGSDVPGDPALEQLRQSLSYWEKVSRDAREKERAQAESQSARLYASRGSALSRLLRCVERMLGAGDGAWEPWRRCALILAKEARQEQDNEALWVALERLEATLEPGAFWRVKKRLQECRDELVGFLRRGGAQLERHHGPVEDARIAPRIPRRAVRQEIDPSLHSDLEEQVIGVLTSADGLRVRSSKDISDEIQTRFGALVDDRKVRQAISRMRDRGWPIETGDRGSRIPPGDRHLLPEPYRD